MALFGRPDFLVRADLLPASDGEPRPGRVHTRWCTPSWPRFAKARAVLQTAFYPASFRSRGLTGERADLLEVFNLDDEAASTLEVVNNALLAVVC